MMPPVNALAWRDEMSSPEFSVNFDAIISDLWQRGIPVVPLNVLPSPIFQAMSYIAEGRPIILLGHKYDEPGRAAFLIVHEVAHLVAGDCAPGRPVVHEEEEITDNSDIERRADQYATRVLVGADTVPEIDGESFRELARSASEIEKRTGADASTLIFAWARRTGDYATATMAVRALYRHLGARRKLRELFDLHVDLSSAGETDRALLRCVHRDPEHNEAAG
jgi:Zn-dependent peptidase ImmA (M78 family)